MSVYGCFQQESNHAYVYLSLRHEPWGRPRFGDFVLCRCYATHCTLGRLKESDSGTCQKLAGGRGGVGILNLGSEIR